MSSSSLRIHFLSIVGDGESSSQASDIVAKRVADISSEFFYNLLPLKNAAQVVDRLADFEDTPFCFYDASQGGKAAKDLSADLVSLRKNLKDCFICVLLPDNDPDKMLEIVKSSGAHLVLFLSDVLNTSRLEFVASQIIRASYAMVKITEFPKDVVLDFTLYHLLPLNQKMLPVLPKGTAFSDARMKKLEELSELFVKRDELDRYRLYMDGRHDVSSGSLKARARAKFLSFCSGHSQLIFTLIDRSEHNVSKEGKWLYDRCEILAKDLLKALSTTSEAWDIINNASLGEFGSLERAPTVASYAGLLSLLASIGEPIDVMMAALLADLGMLNLKPEISKKIRKDQSAQGLIESENLEYQRHPLVSLLLNEEQGLLLSAEVKKIILNSHERVDQKGFPNRPSPDQIPFESMLIQLCELIDNAMIVRMTTARLPLQEVRRAILTQEMKMGAFNYSVLEKLKPVM